jgi:hypothetical protein
MGTTGMSVGATVIAHLRWYHRQVNGQSGDEPVAWFRVHVPHPRLWGGTAAGPARVALDDGVLHRLAAGLRVEDGAAGLTTAVAPAPRAATRVERSYSGMASLLRRPTQCLVGVPEGTATRMRWAAAGCGLLASRLDARPPGTRLRTPAEDAAGPLQVGPLPGWMVGTDVYGAPVVLHLPPGTTALVRGATAAVVSQTIPPSGRIVGTDVDIVSSRADWEAAWDPQRCRVFVDTGGTGGTGDTGTDGPAATPLDAGLVDVTVDLTGPTTGTVQVGGSTVEVTPLALRP